MVRAEPAWHTSGMRWMRAALIALAVLLLAGWEPLWRTDPDVDAGNRAYAQGDYDRALAAYERARGNGVTGAELAYDEGTATLGKAEATTGDKAALYDQAFEQLGDAVGARDRNLRARAHYNRGNIRMRQKKLDDAIREYKDALRSDPTLESARSNLELALRQREKERKQQQGQGQGQPQQGQGQGQQQPQQGQGQGQGQPQQGQGQGQGQQQQPPQQGQGQGQQQQQPPQQGQGQGQPQQQPPQQGQQGQQPGQQGQGGQGQPPARRMPQLPWPSDETEGDTPNTSPSQKLDQLEDMSRQLRRSRSRDSSSGAFQAPPTQDW